MIGDNVLTTDHQLILRSEEEMIPWSDLEVILNKLETSTQEFNYNNARNLLMEAVPGYQPKNDIDDLMYLGS